jgi:hypothetical protein
MFVGVGELIEYQQSTLLVPSVVRLQSLDECLRVWVDAPEHGVAFGRELAAIGEDREPRIPLHALGELSPLVGEGEFVSEVVEGGAEVVYDVTNNEGELGRRRIDNFGVNDILAALQFELGPHSARVAFAPDSLLGFQALQVLTRPI